MYVYESNGYLKSSIENWKYAILNSIILTKNMKIFNWRNED